jgi:hypothetical protein
VAISRKTNQTRAARVNQADRLRAKVFAFNVILKLGDHLTVGEQLASARLDQEGRHKEKRVTVPIARTYRMYIKRYQDGKNCPWKTQRGLAFIELVEGILPGSKRWVDLPLLLTLDPRYATNDEYYDLMERLDPAIRSMLLIAPGVKAIVRRRPREDAAFNELVRIAKLDITGEREWCLFRTLDAAAAVILLIREAKNLSDQPECYVGVQAWHKVAKQLHRYEEIGPFVHEIDLQLQKLLGDFAFSPDGESLLKMPWRGL